MNLARPLILLLAVPLLLITLIVWRNGYRGLSQRRQRVAIAVRIFLIVSVLLAIAGASLQLPASNEAVVFVADRSASVAGQQDAIQSDISAALARRPRGDVAGIVDVAGQSVVEQPPAALGGFGGFQATLPGGAQDHTNLESGLELSGSILPQGYRRRVVLFSDGQANAGDSIGAARLLRSLGVRVDVAPVRVRGGQEVLVDSVSAPAQVRQHETFPVQITVRSTVNTVSGLTVYRDRTLMLSRQVVVRPGENTYHFNEVPLRPGFHAFTVHISPAIDTQLQNNTGSAFTQVQGPARVLVIAAVPREATNVMASLHATGIRADLVSPAGVVSTLQWLQQYAAVVLVDTPAALLDPLFLQQLVPFVRDLGHGLVVIGGQESYGLGGYGPTPLEQVLPVKMDLPKRKNLPGAAVGLIIEDLEEPAQVNISKRAGEGVVNLLTPGDEVAVSDERVDGQFVVPIRSVTDKSAIDRSIEAMQPGDPQSYQGNLRAMYLALKSAPQRTKHIILLGDGDAEDPVYESLVKSIRAGGVTVSTVATNGLGVNDWANMQRIAQWGGGHYYLGNNATAIPRIFVREARTIARSGIVTGKFFPEKLSTNPMLRDVHSVPSLDGYVATTPKATGELVLVSKKLDPVLADWQYGLGRTVAWTSDAAGLWTHSWLRAPGAARFWSNLVSWVLPSVSAGHLYVQAGTSQGQGQIEADTTPSLGGNPTVTADVVGPRQQHVSVSLEPITPGHFRGSFPANSQGAYLVRVSARGQGRAEAGQAGLDVPYSAEFRSSGTDMSMLRAIATAGGGGVVTGPTAAWLNNLPAVSTQQSLSAWLLLLALALLLIDVGVRRLVMDRSDLKRVAHALGLTSGGRQGANPAMIPLAALRVSRAVRASAGQAGSVAHHTRLMSPAMRPRAPSSTSGKSNAGPKLGSKRPAAKPRSNAPEQPATPATEVSTVGKLLASKRKRA